MPFTNKVELEKIPKNLRPQEYYKLLYEWFRKNKESVYHLYKGNDTTYSEISNKIIENLPNSDSVSNEDIVFVCQMVLMNYFEWAYEQRDVKGVLIPAYAQYILDNFFGRNEYAKHAELTRKSKLYDLLPRK